MAIMIAVADNHIVSMRYIMKNSRGLILENTMLAMPVSYLQGGSGILPALQEQIAGLKPGDKKTVYLSKKTGFTTEDFVFDIIIDDVRVAANEEIMLGYPVQAGVQPCEADCQCYKTIPDII
jgi:hypothetical protein